MNTKQINQNCIRANADYFEDEKIVNVDEMEPYYKKFSLTGKEYELTGPTIANFIQNGQRVNYSANPCHALIVGGTGAGKTQCYYTVQAEALARSSNKPSVFFMDLKGEHYRKFSKLYEQNDYNVYVLNLKNPFDSCRYNPLDPVWESYQNSFKARQLLQNSDGTEREFKGQKYNTFDEWKASVQTYQWEQYESCQNYLRRLSQILVPIENKKDPSWDYGSREMVYLQAMGLLEDSENPENNMTREKFTIANIRRIAICTEYNCEYIYDWINAHDDTSAVRGLYNYYTRSAKQTRDCYISTFATKMDKWSNVSTEWITSKSDINVEEIVRNINDQPVAIFCITDENRPEGYDICLTFIDHLIAALKIHHDQTGPLERDFYFLCDEFANMPPMPNLQNRISTLRSYRVWLHMGIQSFDQLDDRYGEKVRNIVVDNCDVQIFFGTNNSKTVKEFAQSLGDKTVAITSYNIGNDGRLSLAISATDRPLIRRSDLSSLKLGEAYVKVFRYPAVFTRLDPHFSCKDLCKDDNPPKKARADLSELDKIVYDIRLLKKENPKVKYNFDFS